MLALLAVEQVATLLMVNLALLPMAAQHATPVLMVPSAPAKSVQLATPVLMVPAAPAKPALQTMFGLLTTSALLTTPVQLAMPAAVLLQPQVHLLQ